MALTIQEAVRMEEISNTRRPGARRISQLSPGVGNGFESDVGRDMVVNKSGYESERKLNRMVSEPGTLIFSSNIEGVGFGCYLLFLLSFSYCF